MAENIPVTLPSKELIQETQALVRAWRSGELTTRGTYPTGDGEPNNSPEVYIAYPQDMDGIPGMNDPGTGTGDETVGSGVCDMAILNGGEIQMLGFSSEVYNISTERFPRVWLLVTLLKSGAFVATLPFKSPIEDELGTGTDGCITINGFALTDIPSVSDPDFVIGVRDGCLVGVQVGECD